MAVAVIPDRYMCGLSYGSPCAPDHLRFPAYSFPGMLVAPSLTVTVAGGGELLRLEIARYEDRGGEPFIVPIAGDCAPSQDALDLVWVTPEEASKLEFQGEMSGGQGRLVRMGLAYCGVLP